MPSDSQSSAITPSTTAGRPSSRNSQRHPASPEMPSNWSRIAPEIGSPRMPAIGIAAMNIAMMRVRCPAGYQYVRYNQYVRYSMMPGNKPAFAIPSSERRM